MTVDPGFHPEARTEFLPEIDHLNAVSPGQGDRFEEALWATADMIALWPRVGARWSDLDMDVEVRSLGIRRFPFRLI